MKTKTNKMKITKFEVGNIYEMRFVTDNDLRPEFICTKVTEKSATFEKFKGGEKFTRRIKNHNGIDYVLYGSYSMAPSIRANKIVG